MLEGYVDRFEVLSGMISLDGQTLIEGNEYFQELNQGYPEALFVYDHRPVGGWGRSRLRP